MYIRFINVKNPFKSISSLNCVRCKEKDANCNQGNETLNKTSYPSYVLPR